MKTNSQAALFLIIVLTTGTISPAFAQSTNDIFLKLVLAPSHVDKKNSVHSIGYVNLVNKNGAAIKAPTDLAVQLKSDDPSIASVPNEVIIPKNANYAVFDISVKNKNGQTRISTILDDKLDHQTLQVGGIDSSMPDDINLKINLPTTKMHVNSEMPFSIFLVDGQGKIIRAPYDLDIMLDFEDSLLEANTEEMKIKSGEYYTWGILSTNKNVGNAFLRATFDSYGIDTAANIEITSSLPSSLKIDVFPYKIGADVERIIDIFISLVDPDGLPAVTPQDVPLRLFSNKEIVGKEFDKTMKEEKVMIKKGEFGYHFRETINMQDQAGQDITVGVSAEDLGIATTSFSVVKPLNIAHPKAENTTLSIYIPGKIPSNTTSILIYQIMAEAKGVNENEAMTVEECLKEAEEAIHCIENAQKEKAAEHPFDELEEGERYPVQGNENFQALGANAKINVVSSDSAIIKIKNPGGIQSTHSYGTAILKSGQKNGMVTVAATIKGVGAGTNTTEVVDVFKHVGTKIFSPTGNDVVVLDKNGYFDLFLLALDGKDRPKILERPAKYLLTPINEVIEINEDRSFAFANFHSDSFNSGESEVIEVEAVPIGVDAQLDLEADTKFGTQVSSIIKIEIPFKNLDSKSVLPYNGIVQLTDLLGNPSKSTKDLRVKLVAEGADIIDMPEQVTIPKGSSYATFPITANGQNGDAVISASIKGVIGSEAKVSTTSNDPQLKIFAEGIEGPIDAGVPVQIKVYVDDENAESVPGASVKFQANNGAEITPNDIKTGTDGSITADLTASEGPLVSVSIFASADGYVDAQQTFDYQVNNSPISIIDLGLPEWVMYVGLAAIVGIIAVVMVFLKKPKEVLEEEEEYEYEEDI